MFYVLPFHISLNANFILPAPLLHHSYPSDFLTFLSYNMFKKIYICKIT